MQSTVEGRNSENLVEIKEGRSALKRKMLETKTFSYAFLHTTFFLFQIFSLKVIILGIIMKLHISSYTLIY